MELEPLLGLPGMPAECLVLWSRGRHAAPEIWRFWEQWSCYEKDLEQRHVPQKILIAAVHERRLMWSTVRLRTNEQYCGLGNFKLGQKIGVPKFKRICGAPACWTRSNQFPKLPWRL
jgi:hypothetical protein